MYSIAVRIAISAALSPEGSSLNPSAIAITAVVCVRVSRLLHRCSPSKPQLDMANDNFSSIPPTKHRSSFCFCASPRSETPASLIFHGKSAFNIVSNHLCVSGDLYKIDFACIDKNALSIPTAIIRYDRCMRREIAIGSSRSTTARRSVRRFDAVRISPTLCHLCSSQPVFRRLRLFRHPRFGSAVAKKWIRFPRGTGNRRA